MELLMPGGWARAGPRGTQPVQQRRVSLAPLSGKGKGPGVGRPPCEPAPGGCLLLQAQCPEPNRALWVGAAQRGGKGNRCPLWKCWVYLCTFQCLEASLELLTLLTGSCSACGPLQSSAPPDAVLGHHWEKSSWQSRVVPGAPSCPMQNTATLQQT